jgi:hypothetical protein
MLREVSMRFVSCSFVLVVVTVTAFACKKETGGAPTCGERVDAFEEALAPSTVGTCAVDADCRCYPGGVSRAHACGGIADTKTAEKLMSIAAEYKNAGCKSGIDCAASLCLPKCEAGKCTFGPPPVAIPPVPEGGVKITCADRAGEIDKALAAGTRKCAADQDCACFRGGVSKKDPCGGITDAKTNARVEALAKEWTAAGCKSENVMCPAMVCEPKCNAGTCGPPGTIVQ